MSMASSGVAMGKYLLFKSTSESFRLGAKPTVITEILIAYPSELTPENDCMTAKTLSKAANGSSKDKSLETWIWDAACSIRGAQDAAKYKDFILPQIFAKRLFDVFDDELDKVAANFGSRAKAFALVKMDKKLVRFYLPLQPENPDDAVWSVIRTLSDKIGETLTGYLRDIAKENSLLKGIVDRVDFNATTHGQRDLDDDRLSNIIEKISEKRLGLEDVEADIIGRSYEYLMALLHEGGV